MTAWGGRGSIGPIQLQGPPTTGSNPKQILLGKTLGELQAA